MRLYRRTQRRRSCALAIRESACFRVMPEMLYTFKLRWSQKRTRSSPVIRSQPTEQGEAIRRRSSGLECLVIEVDLKSNRSKDVLYCLSFDTSGVASGCPAGQF